MHRHRTTFLIVLLAVLAFLALRFLVFDIYRIDGDSMEPELPAGAIVIVLRSAFSGDPETGDIVFAASENRKIVKRVAALGPADIAWKNGTFYINGTIVDRYRYRPQLDIPGTCRVEPDSLFLLGDNMRTSSDSRSIGAVHRTAILGRVVWVLFPLPLFGLVH